MRFYVYELMHGDQCMYIGKGSDYRLANQKSAFGLKGHEIAYFRREQDAYKFEREMIAERSPWLNRHPGGNGSRVTPIRAPRMTKEIRRIQEIGSRAYAAMLVLRYRKHHKPGVLADLISVVKTGLTLAEIALNLSRA